MTGYHIYPVAQKDNGYHTCNAEYGWCGEHRAITAVFKCPKCEDTFELQLCSAWPIQEQWCPCCHVCRVHCMLDQKRTTAALR